MCQKEKISVEADIVLFHFVRPILIMQEIHVNKKKVSECDQEIPQPTHGTVRKNHRTFTVTIHLLDNNSKVTSFSSSSR